MFRQIILLLGIVLLLLAMGLLVLYFKPNSTVTVYFKDNIVPDNALTGEITKKDKYIIIKPKDAQEQVFAWDQVKSIVGDEPSYTKRLDDVTDLLELIAKLGILAAAGVFLIGLYQFDVGQRWKREEFLAQTVKDFNSSVNVENAKQ